ncbi:uncharacterized protein LOC119743416 [Patiria miniata]|uniref:C2H2-type domain-containing protein n=1 Tax=Patiria miniata TaxID=46514 RepID=A0A914BIL1_PATMI|nr:uncharacterized protein LOC119743416 [Patiria miniata]
MMVMTLMNSLIENLLSSFHYTVEDGPTSAYSDSIRLAPPHHQTAAPSDLSEEFMCKECNVVYRSYKSLWQHNKDNHQEKFSCGYCEYSSARMYNIRQHRKRRHPNMPDPFDPNLVDMFPSAYLDDTRLEYPLGDSDEEADHIREPVNKRARYSQNTVSYSDMGDTCSSESPPVASKSLQGSSQAREVHYNTSHAAVYPVSLSNSREAVSHPGLHGRQFQPQRSQAQAQSSRSEAQTVHVTNHTATMPVLPRITSVSGGSLGIHASSVNAGMLHSSTAHSHSSREQQVHNLRTTRNSQENSDPRRDMGRSVTFSGPANMANESGSRQLLPSHRTVSPREDNRMASASCVSSSQRTTSTCTQLKPMHETVSGGTATTPRDAQNVQNKAPQSMSTRGGSEKKWDSQAQSSGPTCIYRPTGLGQRNSGTSSMETRHPTRINSNTEPSRSPRSSPSSNPIRGGSCKGTPSQVQESASQQGARATHSFTTVGGVLDEHRQGVGLTDIQSLLPNFRVKSITERVVQPDGTRYEIQIDGEEIH